MMVLLIIMLSLHHQVVNNSGLKKVAFGINVDRPYFGMQSRHAEIDALLKLKNTPYYSLGRKLDLYVFRFKKTGELAESKPCFYCIKKIASMQLNIKYIYYSTSDNTIVKSTLTKLLDSPQYITYGQRKK